ncbi:MAG TPA: NADH-ubiquinone oxidoreductase-F iron-sulfur binding region domain-containing protein [Acetobacteraceae bacterium]|nr:NADH-ubiquinone oxidoreductase-F iron-sulfur binding region domain-containing protein [Acetobacteraceae bacterium]
MTRLYLPKDVAALALGADQVAKALLAEAARRGLSLDIVRTGTRGAIWLEPLLEIETPEGRIAYGPVEAADVPGLLDAGLLEGREHALRIGRPEEHAWFARQTRLTFARCGVVDPVSVADYRAYGGYAGLERALAIGGDAVVDEVKRSGLRGRGGAGFPTGIKWNTVRLAQADRKYIVCNADEGDSGTFADRMLMEGDPFSLIEGMTIAAVAVGASKGYIYTRSEYPHAIRTMRAAIEAARAAGLLGPDIMGSGDEFDLEVRMGAGAYICGEETSLLDSLEGKRGVVRAKPPLPAIQGLFARPTVVNNVLSLASVPWILANGADAYAAFGMGRSLGTLAVQLAGNVARGGLIELPFGPTLRSLIEEWGRGTASGRPFRAVQVGGPLGAYFPESLLDTPMDYEAFAAAGGLLGHGGVVVFDDTVNLAHQARFAFEFCAAESCGKCTPCRIGAVRGMEVVDRILAGVEPAKNFAVLDDLCQLMTDASLCAMGGLTPIPVNSALTHFPEDFDAAARLQAAAE